MGWTRHVIPTEEIKMHTKFWLENMKERDHLEDLLVDGSIILKSILNKQGVRVWTGLIWFRIGTDGGHL
jgi:hypothetical protein